MMDEQNTQADGTGLAPVEDVRIETEGTKGHHMDVGPGVLTIDLPCGFIDEEGKLHDTLMVGEMTGYEEDILAGKGPIVPRLNQIIANCTRRFGAMDDKRDIGRAVTNMAAADRLAALIAIRRVSLGDFYDVKIECPSCREQSRFSLNLAQIDINRMKDQMKREREDVLTTNRSIRWHVMSAADEEWLSKRTKRKEDVLTLAMLARVDAVETDLSGDGTFESFEIDRDGKGFKQALAVLKSLSIRERNDIRKLFDEHEGSVDTDVEFACPACQYEWKSDLDVGQAGFFFPSDT